MPDPINIDDILARVRAHLVRSAEALARLHGTVDADTVVVIDDLSGPTWTGSGNEGSKVGVRFAVKLAYWCPAIKKTTP